MGNLTLHLDFGDSRDAERAHDFLTGQLADLKLKADRLAGKGRPPSPQLTRDIEILTKLCEGMRVTREKPNARRTATWKTVRARRADIISMAYHRRVDVAVVMKEHGVSETTARRDIYWLVEQGMLRPHGAGGWRIATAPKRGQEAS